MKRPIWYPEIVVDVALARGLIRSQFPQVDVTSVEPMGFGYDNTAFLVAETFVFRFPRRGVSAELIGYENAVLPLIAGAVPIAVPVPTLLGVPEHPYPWPFAGYKRLSGRTACAVDLDANDRVALTPALGGFLRALHAIDPAEATSRGLPGDKIGRLDHAGRLPLAIERFAELQAAGLVDDAAPYLDFMAAHPPQRCDDTRIVHGDMYARHILLDDAKRLCGAIDWGDVHRGDPALDLAIALMVLPPQAHAAFAQAYGAISDATWERATYRAVYHAALVTHYGRAEGDAGMLRIGLDALAFLREVLA